MTAINSLSFPFLSLFLSSLSPDSLSFPFLSLRQRERKGRSRKEENKERKRKEKGKEREYIVVIFPHFSLFFFFSFFFFPSSLSCPLLIASVLSHVASLHFENCHAKFAVFSRCISSCVSSKVFLLMYPSPARQFIQISAES